MFACLYRPPAPEINHRAHGNHRAHRENVGSVSSVDSVVPDLIAIAQEFSPRYEAHGADLVSIDVRGLERLLGTPRAIGEELRREAASRGVRAHVALAGTRMAALVLAIARPGLTVVERGGEAAALAPLPIGILDKIYDNKPPQSAQSTQNSQKETNSKAAVSSVVSVVKHWGLKTLGELAALPRADLRARLGATAFVYQAIARGEDVQPLVPTLAEERFDAALDLEWPIEGREPLSFVLTRLLEPLCTRLERRDRGVAVLHVELRLVTKELVKEIVSRHIELPSPMRDVRALRTLALLDLESHPPSGAIDRVSLVVDPTPGRVLQHTLFTRAHPAPEQVATLLARLSAIMGHDRVGMPAPVDSHRPGAFEMQPFAIERSGSDGIHHRGHPQPLASSLRRCRQPVPARVVVAGGRPERVTSDRRGFAGGAVTNAVGPWRTSGHWWAAQQDSWNRDEWDVALADGAVYRLFRDRDTDAWFFDAIVD